MISEVSARSCWPMRKQQLRKTTTRLKKKKEVLIFQRIMIGDIFKIFYLSMCMYHDITEYFDLDCAECELDWKR